MSGFYITEHARQRWSERFSSEQKSIDEAVKADLSKVAALLSKAKWKVAKVRCGPRKYVLKGRAVVTVYPSSKEGPRRRKP